MIEGGGQRGEKYDSCNGFSGRKKMHEIYEEDEMAILEYFKVIQEKAQCTHNFK